MRVRNQKLRPKAIGMLAYIYFVQKLSIVVRFQAGGRMRFLSLFAAGLLGFMQPSQLLAQELKVGFVNTERILRDSAPAKASQQKLEQEFSLTDDLEQGMKKVPLYFRCIALRFCFCLDLFYT